MKKILLLLTTSPFITRNRKQPHCFILNKIAVLSIHLSLFYIRLKCSHFIQSFWPEAFQLNLKLHLLGLKSCKTHKWKARKGGKKIYSDCPRFRYFLQLLKPQQEQWLQLRVDHQRRETGRNRRGTGSQIRWRDCGSTESHQNLSYYYSAPVINSWWSEN